MKRVAVDTGGTFTDFVFQDGETTRVHKVSSTPEDPSRAIQAGLATWFDDLYDVELTHGSTVGTNALLERRGAVTALVTTAGFEDVLAIGRQDRPSLYDLDQTVEPPLVPEERRLGVAERVYFDGRVGTPLEPAEVARVASALASIPGLEAIAVVLLHSYANPDHEAAIGRALSGLGLHVSLSSDVLPEYREFERTSTTVVNAYLAPVMSRYLDRLERDLVPGRLRVMHSGGGTMSARSAGRHAGRTVLSGPAGGVLGGARVARLAGFHEAVTFDMGGTSTDVALVRGEPTTTSESSIDRMPIRFPMLDVHTVGAGGGSIAFLDPGGALAVGPRSAGARPGPICYGRGGDEVTVTDANLYLGRLDPGHFLGGSMRLDAESATRGLERLSRQVGLPPVAVARGVLRVACARMERAIRVISIERGHDPRDFALVAFGGAGPMHGCDLAAALAMPAVVVPPDPGALSARGMLRADLVKDASRTWLGRPAEEAVTAFGELESRVLAEMAADGVAFADVRLSREVDLRYVGQSFELTVPAGEGMRRRFDEAHEARYGHAHSEWRTEIVNLRVRGVAPVDAPPEPADPEGPADAGSARIGEARVVFDEPLRSTIYDRGRLAPGNAFDGPALAVELSATTVVPPGWRARVDPYRNLVLTRCSP